MVERSSFSFLLIPTMVFVLYLTKFHQLRSGLRSSAPHRPAPHRSAIAHSNGAPCSALRCPAAQLSSAPQRSASSAERSAVVCRALPCCVLCCTFLLVRTCQQYSKYHTTYRYYYYYTRFLRMTLLLDHKQCTPSSVQHGYI